MVEIINKLKQIPLNLIFFVSLFCLLAISVSKLGLYIDDHVLIFPSLLKSYWAHFTGYTYDYGLMRPLALLFYYFIYDFSLLWMKGAHLFAFGLHFLTGV